MAEYILKDSRGKEQTFADDKIFAQGTDGELVQFTMGTGGSASADLHYVTFMSYDGLTEYGKKAVADGDDCADPIARGIFDTPIRESDAQYNYTHSGWATEANGAADADWNKAVTEDRTVYASFTSAVRYYTITYYDDDGTTVLNTESLAYGTMPSYKPTKDGVVFDNWSPELTVVTGDASYTAIWSEKLTFADATWADIARIAEAGEASKHFSVGDTRTIETRWLDYNGNIVNTTSDFEIIDFDYDNLADGTGKAGMTIASKRAFHKGYFIGNVATSLKVGYENTTIYSDMNSVGLANLPVDLQSVIKEVSKAGIDGGTFTAKVWIPSSGEFSHASVRYERYATAENRIKLPQEKANLGEDAVKHMTRSRYSASSHFNYYVNQVGSVKADAGEYEYCVVAFCI